MEAVEGVNEGVTLNEVARKLGVSRVMLSCVLNGRAAIYVSLALKLEFAGWGKAEVWMRRQARYDSACERNRLGQWPEEPAFEAGAAYETGGVDSLSTACGVEGEHVPTIEDQIELIGIEAEALRGARLWVPRGIRCPGRNRPTSCSQAISAQKQTNPIQRSKDARNGRRLLESQH